MTCLKFNSYITFESDVSIADKFVDTLFDKFDLLALNNKMGISVDNIHPDLRRIVHGRYLIFYIPTSYGAEIERVLHSARNISKYLKSIS